MRLLTLALLLVAPLVAQADDPRFLAAARERQAKAKAFEATFTLTYEWKQHKPFGVEGPPRDYTEMSSAKLKADGPNYRLEMDQPMMTDLGPVRRQWVITYDGRSFRIMAETPTQLDPRTGETARLCVIVSDHSNPRHVARWRDPLLPMYWALRGGDCGLLLSDRLFPEVEPDVTDSVRATGRRERIGGRDCVEYEWTRPHRRGSPTKRSMWFDPVADYIPRRVGHVEVDYTPHPACGWVPVRWALPAHDPNSVGGIVHVNVDTFQVRDSISPDTFTLTFPVGSTVNEVRRNDDTAAVYTVAEDGSLIPTRNEPTTPEAELPSLHEWLWVVGVAVAVFVGFVVLLKRVARSRTDDSANSAGSRNLPT